MIIKHPACFDTSHWESVPDFALVSPRPKLVITKATEGTSYVDDTFVRYFSDLKQDGIYRGAYHFFHKDYNAILQADFFCDTVRPLLTSKDILILDVEEGGETAAQLKAWFEYCMDQFPNNTFMLYSRKNILDAIPMFLRPLVDWLFDHPLNAIQMTTTEREFFKRIPIWTAGYPFNPDAYNTVPAGYIPDQTKFGAVELWQYSDRGIVTGIGGEVDCNWISPALISRLDGVSQPFEIITNPFNGMTKYHGTVNGVNYYLYKVDLSQDWCVRVRHFDGHLGLASQAAKADGAQLVVNGDDYLGNGPFVPSSMAYTDGMVYQAVQTDFRPFLDIQKNNEMFVGHLKAFTPYNLTSFVHYLIRNGTPEAWLSDMTKIEASEIHAISAKGYDKDGNLLLLVIEGKVDPQTGKAIRGARLQHAANILLAHGAVWAGQSGGGGDAGVFENGIMINEPSDPTERGVVQVLELFNDNGGSMTRYTAKAIGNDTRLRPDHNTGNVAIGSYPIGTAFSGDVLWTAVADLFNASGVKYQAIGDVWLQTITPKAGWVAVKNMGVAITTLTDNGSLPVKTVNELRIVPAKGTVITRLYSDGTQDSETTP